MAYKGKDRGGSQGASIRSAGAVNTTVLRRPNFESYLANLGKNQNNPCVGEFIKTYLDEELEELKEFTGLKKIKIGVALEDGNAMGLLEKLYQEYQKLGGKVIDAWVTRLHADETGCRGLQYEKDDKVGKIIAPNIVHCFWRICRLICQFNEYPLLWDCIGSIP